MSGHAARAEIWDGEHRAGCAQCGWVGRRVASAAQAERMAERHNTVAAAHDEKLRLGLYGPRPSR